MILDAEVIGLKEGFKIGLVWLVFYSFLLFNDRTNLLRAFYAGFILSVLACFSLLMLPDTFLPPDTVGNIISMSFALFLIASGAALYHVSGTNLFLGRREIRSHAVMYPVVFIATVIFFLPDLTGSVFYLRDLALLNENIVLTTASALAGLLIASVVVFTVIKLYRPFGCGGFFDLPQLLLFLALVKLLGSGIRGFAELSLIPSVQRGFMKFIHDVVHQTFVMLMVPDHPLLKQTTWNFIGIFFGPGFASMASLFILLSIPAVFIHYSLFSPLPEPESGTSITRRKIRSLIQSDRRKKALPVMLFVIFILIAWFSQRGETVSRIYNPDPRPVVAENGVVIIPIKGPAEGVMDGRLHKFALLHEGEEIRLLVIRKADNTLSVCLDACEICPPEGYGQKDDHVICIYCKTPIPVNTLGDAGGCNPIPLTAEIDNNFIRIDMQEIIKKWGFVKLKSDS